MPYSVNFLLDSSSSSSSYSADFPTAIGNTDEVDPISRQSFAEAFQSAQSAYVPYYSVVVVQSGNQEEEFYHIYDTHYFIRYRIRQESLQNSNPVVQDPITGRGIQKVYYFAIKCFQPDGEKFCRPTDLQSDQVGLIPFEIEQLQTDVQTMVLDGINGNIFETGQEKDKKQVRRTQDIIANLIKRKAIFTHLSDSERKNETMQWLWCSSKESYVGLVDLAKEYIEQHPSDSKAKRVSVALLSKIYPLPNKKELHRREIQALVEGQNLFAKLTKEIASLARDNHSPRENTKSEQTQ